MCFRRSQVRVVLLGAAAAGAFSLEGCLNATHVLGDAADASSAPPRAGSADSGLADAAAASDASTSGATVASLGDKTSLGWSIAIPPQEVARRLSQFLLQKPPSAALTAAIAASAPATNQDVGDLTDGLLLDESSLAGRQAFYRWWLDLDYFFPFDPGIQPERDPLFPLFTPDVRQALIDQTLAFIEEITWRPDGDLSTLLTEPAAFVTTATAPWFPGVEVPTGTTARRLDLDPAQYAGIVTQPPVVATADFADRTSPVYRGRLVLQRYLCQSTPDPPPGEPPLVPDPAGKITIRQTVEAYGSNPSCAPCHQFIDPPGFAFGHFDAVGAYHDTEGGLPIDTTGVLKGVVGAVTFSFDESTGLWISTPTPPSGAAGAISFSFDGPPSLASQLAALPEVRTCFAAEWLTFATGKDSPPDSYPLHYDVVGAANGGHSLAADADYVVKRATIQGRLNLRGTIRAVTETHAFLDP
jgi:hypothetical protein